jgi:3-methyladenine DNA glycosylase/8-oxoguanine DNA glycosylase
MARLIEREGPLLLHPRRVSTFQSLTQAIIHQQLSGKAAGTILGRFRDLYPGKRFPSARDVLETSPEKLREAGLSRPKATYILDLAQRVKARSVPGLKASQHLSDDELIHRLTTVKGIGRWTAEMLLIFNLGREDVLPVDDLGIRRGFQLAHGHHSLPAPRELSAHGIRWAPFRSVAALYLWRAADTTQTL